MTHHDLPDDMNKGWAHRFGQPDGLHLDDSTADALLDNTLGAVPEPYEHVAAMLASMATVEGDAVENPEFVQQMARAVADYRPETRRSRVIGKFLTTKALVSVAGVVALSSGGVAAAATGSLPDPVQNAAASAAAKVNIDLPKPKDLPSAAQLCAQPHATTTTTTALASNESTTTTTVVAHLPECENRDKPHPETVTEGTEPPETTIVPAPNSHETGDDNATEPETHHGESADNSEHSRSNDSGSNDSNKGKSTTTTIKTSDSGKGSGDKTTTTSTTRPPSHEEHASTTTTSKPTTTTTSKSGDSGSGSGGGSGSGSGDGGSHN